MLHDAAIAAGLQVHLITDSGKTEFHGQPTRTCLAIGPDLVEKIDEITGQLQHQGSRIRVNSESKPWPTFNAETLSLLSEDELSEINRACLSFNETFNSVFDKEYRYEWTASPLNLANLDYDFYEFGGGHWYADNGYGFSCAWGEILVTSFGFQWMKMDGGASLRDWVLRHEDANIVLFPWQTLWSIVESAGFQFEKAIGAWISVLDRVDSVYGLPSGWHPVIDTIQGEANWIPEEVRSEAQRLYDHPNWSFHGLGLWPYEWTENSNWEDVRNRLKLKRMNCE